MKTILIINGNPKEHSLSKSIVDSYKKGAENETTPPTEPDLWDVPHCSKKQGSSWE
jgi:hypothetical protein